MKIIVKETREEKELTVRDPGTGLDWPNDFLGNSFSDLEWDEEDRLLLSQEDYDWRRS